MKTIKIYSANKQSIYQTVVGFFGSDNLPPAFEQAAIENNWEFVIRHCMPFKAKRTKDGRFYKAGDANMAANNISTYCQAGGMYLKGKGVEQDIYGVSIEILNK